LSTLEIPSVLSDRLTVKRLHGERVEADGHRFVVPRDSLQAGGSRMPDKAKPIPDGFHTVTPYLVVDDAKAVIAFMQQAFGAEFDHRPTRRPDGKLMHATLRIGDARVMIGNASERARAMPAMLYVYVPNVDEVYAAAIKAGGTSIMAPSDMFYGDRSGGVTDPGGNQWYIGTHIEDVSEQELEKRAKEMFAKG
jgi:uncharacterized glyoxalase superfamily protein PhnB